MTKWDTRLFRIYANQELTGIFFSILCSKTHICDRCRIRFLCLTNGMQIPFSVWYKVVFKEQSFEELNKRNRDSAAEEFNLWLMSNKQITGTHGHTVGLTVFTEVGRRN